MPRASSTASRKAPTPKVTEPAVAPKEVVTEPVTEPRVEGGLYVTETGTVLRNSGGRLTVLHSDTHVLNVHPNRFSPEEYERLIAERFGPLTLIYPK